MLFVLSFRILELFDQLSLQTVSRPPRKVLNLSRRLTDHLSTKAQKKDHMVQSICKVNKAVYNSLPASLWALYRP